MRIYDKQTGQILGKVITNHSMSLAEACELAGVECDPDTMDATPYDTDDEQLRATDETMREFERALGADPHTMGA